MNKDQLKKEFETKYEELKKALNGDDLSKIKALTLEVHAIVHPREVSGMILTPLTYHHMMHLPACVDHLSIL